jgi:RNA-directed DNA polymerase
LETLVNTGEPWQVSDGPGRGYDVQTKLHQWAAADHGRRFDDLFNLVHDPDFLAVAWERVRGSKGAPTAGVDRLVLKQRTPQRHSRHRRQPPSFIGLR